MGRRVSILAFYCLATWSFATAFPADLPSAKGPPKKGLLKKALCISAVVALAAPPAVILMGPSLYDFRLSDLKEREREEHIELKNHLGRIFGEDLKSKQRTLEQMRAIWKQRLIDAKPTLDAVTIEWGILNYFYSKEDFALYALLIDPNFKPQGENIYLGFNYLTDEQHILRATDLEIFKMRESGVSLHPDQKIPESAYDYDFKKWSYDELRTRALERIEKALAFERPEGPQIIEEDGGSWSLGTPRLSIAANDADEKIVLKEIHRLFHIVSPLFEELMKRPDHSVSQQEFFDMALKIYGDPWTALGAIGFLTAWDGTLDRSRESLVAHKLKPVVEGSNDPAGNLYHFWNYAIRSVYHGSSMKLDRLSWGYESVMQGDSSDRIADKLGLELGREITKPIPLSVKP